MSEGRIWHQSWTPQLRLYFLLFCAIAALFHPSDQLSSVSIAIQISFWVIGYLIFIFCYPFILLGCLRAAQIRGWSGVYISVPLELTIILMAVSMYGFAKVVGIPTGDVWDLSGFMAFNVVLFELAAFCYIAYVDPVIFPEIYEVPSEDVPDQRPRELILRGSTIPVNLVEVIAAQDNGVLVSAQGQEVFIARPFGLVVSELPVDLGFQIHRSLWVSRNLALNFAAEGRRHLIQLPDGRRFPIARSRQSEYRNWLDLNRKGRSARA
jgi:hypothetical protein